MSTLRKSVHLPWSSGGPSSHEHQAVDPLSCPVTPCQQHGQELGVCTCSEKTRSRSGLNTVSAQNNPMARVIGMFRNRSLSMGYNELRRVSISIFFLNKFLKFFYIKINFYTNSNINNKNNNYFKVFNFFY